MFDELANGLSHRYQTPPSSAERDRYKKYVEAMGEEIALDATYAGTYHTIETQTANPSWFVTTLRKYAELIPIPPAPHPETGKDHYDYYPNDICVNPWESYYDERRRHRAVIRIACLRERVNGLAGMLSPRAHCLKRGASEEPESENKLKRRKGERSDEGTAA